MKQSSVNVAPASTAGHYVEKAKQVVCLDENRSTFLVEGSSALTTKNHTTLEMKDDCLIFPQQVYDEFSKSYRRAAD